MPVLLGGCGAGLHPAARGNRPSFQTAYPTIVASWVRLSNTLGGGCRGV